MEALEQGGPGCPWQSCSRGLLCSCNYTRQLRESQNYSAWIRPEGAGYTLHFGKPLLLIILMDLTPAVPGEQAPLTWLTPGQRDPNSSAVLL